MKDNTIIRVEQPLSFGTLESTIRGQVQDWMQSILDEEVTEFLGRMKSERRKAVDDGGGYRNGYGEPRKLTLSSGTIELRRPRVSGLEQRFESRILPLYQARIANLTFTGTCNEQAALAQLEILQVAAYNEWYTYDYIPYRNAHMDADEEAVAEYDMFCLQLVMVNMCIDPSNSCTECEEVAEEIEDE